jgi:hypothetical protein
MSLPGMRFFSSSFRSWLAEAGAQRRIFNSDGLGLAFFKIGYNTNKNG